MQNLLEGLNKEQQRAVTTTEGPLLILAGAGSGKTKTLTHRVAYLLKESKLHPSQILAVTFTNKAAGEMRERVAKLLGENSNNKSFMPYMGTFHSICVKLLRKDGEYIGLPSNFVIFDESDRTSLVKQICRTLLIDEKVTPARIIGSIISSAKNEMLTPAEYESEAGTPTQKVAAKVFPLYEAGLRSQKALDFDDLIGQTVHMLENNPQVQKRWQDQFKYILIDEYQDTNAAQYRLIKLLTANHNNICVVGDDWQSIYSWRGADFRNILNFERDYPKCTVIKLEQNYRSTQYILSAAHNIITKNKDRSEKKLWTSEKGGQPVNILPVANERAEGEAIIRIINSNVDLRVRKYSDFAVLYRTNAQSRSLEEQFIRYQIPYKIVGGVRFYDRAEIKDILAYLRLIYQPEDQVSFRRIINIPARGIGAKSVEQFLDWRKYNDLSLNEALANVQKSNITARAKNAIQEFCNIIFDLRKESENVPVSTIIEGLLKRIKYIKSIDDGSVQAESRIENIKELQSVAKAYSEVGLASFLEEIALISDLDNYSSQSDAVTLMTLHSAKGLEFSCVFMPGLEESLFPHSRALYDNFQMEEERRLCYVGMTRARQELYLLYADSRILYGGILHNPPSRFISEIDSQYINLADYTYAKNTYQTDIISDNMATAYNEPRYVPDLQVGDKVKHQIFGIGTVIETQGDNVAVNFNNKGVKKLNISFAPLEKL